MIIGSEARQHGRDPSVQRGVRAIRFAATAIKPSYGIAEATLFVSTIAPTARPTVSYLDREQLTNGRAVRVAADAPGAVAQVSCGQIARSQWAVIVDPDTGDGTARRAGRRDLVARRQYCRGYWGRPEEPG